MNNKIRCPNCGHPQQLSKFYSRVELKEIYESLPLVVQDNVKYVMQQINDNIPSDIGLEKKGMFLKRIKDIDAVYVNQGCEAFIRQNLAEHNKGYYYLLAIIENQEKNHKKFAERERKIYGSQPPVVSFDD